MQAPVDALQVLPFRHMAGFRMHAAVSVNGVDLVEPLFITTVTTAE
jgi:hypothetical protein